MRLGVIGAGSFGGEILKIVSSLPDIEIARSRDFQSLVFPARKLMSRSGPPKPMMRMLHYAQGWAATVDSSSIGGNLDDHRCSQGIGR